MNLFIIIYYLLLNFAPLFTIVKQTSQYFIL